MEQQVIAGEIGDLENKGGELFDIVVYAPHQLEVLKFAPCLVKDIIWEELTLELMPRANSA